MFTGGVNPYRPELPPEGDIHFKEAISYGIPSSLFFTTKKVLNTFEE